MFDEPSDTGSGRCYPKDVVNHLLLVWSVDYIAHSPTQFSRPDKPSDVVIVDVVDLDAVDEEGQIGQLTTKAWWRQAKLIQSLKPRIGNTSPMLVRMTKGVGSKGMNAPFELVSQTGDPNAVRRAETWLAANPGFKPSTADPYRSVEAPREQDPGPPADRDFSQPREETTLERMARQSQEYTPLAQRAGLPPPRPGESDIPF